MFCAQAPGYAARETQGTSRGKEDRYGAGQRGFLKESEVVSAEHEAKGFEQGCRYIVQRIAGDREQGKGEAL